MQAATITPRGLLSETCGIWLGWRADWRTLQGREGTGIRSNAQL